MAKLVNWQRFERTLKEKGIFLFSATDIRRLFGATKVAATFLLYRYSQQGFILRAKRGLYTFPDALPPEPYLANKIYAPSYLSMEFALSYHEVIPETVYEITSITTKTTRRFESLGKIYSYRTIKKRAYTGYTLAKQRGFTFYIADPEKAFVDTVYFRMFDGLEPMLRFHREKIDFRKALNYAKLFDNDQLTGLIKERGSQ